MMPKPFFIYGTGISFGWRNENTDKKLTAYCGLCCADCIPSREELFALVDRLDQMLEQLQFDQYAELKSSQHKDFEDYPTFLSVLRQIKELRCPVPCRQGGGKSHCEVRACARARGWRVVGNAKTIGRVHSLIDCIICIRIWTTTSTSLQTWGLPIGSRRGERIMYGNAKGMPNLSHKRMSFKSRAKCSTSRNIWTSP